MKLLEKEPAKRPDAVQVKADLRAATKQMRNASTMVGPMFAADPEGLITQSRLRRHHQTDPALAAFDPATTAAPELPPRRRAPLLPPTRCASGPSPSLVSRCSG